MVKLLLLLILAFSFPTLVLADDSLNVLSVSTTDSGSEYSVKLQILILMTALSFIPAFIIMCTSFTRIIIVLSILRQAIGLQQSPPNQILVGLALIFTILIMRPVWTDIYDNAYQPYANGEQTLQQTMAIGEKPLRKYMLDQTQEKTLEQVTAIAGLKMVDKPDIPFLVLLPAYVLSELKAAFQIGLMIYLPFIVIDLVVASVLMSMGMMMLSPLIVSLPFKLLLFVLVDGWGMLMGSLAQSFWVGT
ncbi:MULTISPECIES: flagellar type III secretion system pore protein FliP [Vibrio]|uniref:Flagellar biosynthetic protein FliP n=1 Tax=Vibrio casei TaxID=673372 RepID=A0A368LJ39_9VIBR|nr:MULTISPECIES: flagellar type III secretion system pore protein FliP [Vibrio]RCS70727.1 flagellar biosynthetic protein FliP [Vibrio casei]SJN26618.1 Flagellar biosynthesis protein FliP [Vibrio casei]HBV77561.1 flagellar biosynthetic protein FliP [Vibrio sp.]